MGIGHSTATNSTNFKNETKNAFEKQNNLIKNNITNDNISRSEFKISSQILMKLIPSIPKQTL